jgi:hypothetical protein
MTGDVGRHRETGPATGPDCAETRGPPPCVVLRVKKPGRSMIGIVIVACGGSLH